MWTVTLALCTAVLSADICSNGSLQAPAECALLCFNYVVYEQMLSTLPLLPRCLLFLACFQEIQDKVISPEKAEEAKLKARYPNLGNKPGGSDLLRKRLQKGVSCPPVFVCKTFRVHLRALSDHSFQFIR